jgi:hypothetical protein
LATNQGVGRSNRSGRTSKTKQLGQSLIGLFAFRGEKTGELNSQISYLVISRLQFVRLYFLERLEKIAGMFVKSDVSGRV